MRLSVHTITLHYLDSEGAPTSIHVTLNSSGAAVHRATWSQTPGGSVEYSWEPLNSIQLNTLLDTSLRSLLTPKTLDLEVGRPSSPECLFGLE